MRIDDLHIGDWVYNMHHKENIRITPYDYFTHTHKDGVQSLAEHPTRTLGRDLVPIPVTKELLELNGWVRIGFSFVNKNIPSIRLEVEVNGETSVYGVCSASGAAMSCAFSYVHEFQAVLRVMGYKDYANDLSV